MGKVISRNDVGELASLIRGHGKRVGTTNGAFDLLHVGHLRCLQEARGMCDALLVGVNADDSPHFLGKPGRPIIPGSARVEMVAGLACVDWAFLFSEGNPTQWVLEIRPYVHVKSTTQGYDLSKCIEREAVESCGGRVALIKPLGRWSTTSIIEKIRENPGICRDTMDLGGGMLDYSKLPERFQESVRLYIEHGIMPGDFLTAVLENNLVESFGRADEESRSQLFNLCRWIYGEVPVSCWGSREKVERWAKQRRALNAMATAAGS